MVLHKNAKPSIGMHLQMMWYVATNTSIEIYNIVVRYERGSKVTLIEMQHFLYDSEALKINKDRVLRGWDIDMPWVLDAPRRYKLIGNDVWNNVTGCPMYDSRH